MTLTEAAEHLATATRDQMPRLITTARQVRAETPNRDVALAELTAQLAQDPPDGVAAVAAEALLRLTEGS